MRISPLLPVNIFWSLSLNRQDLQDLRLELGAMADTGVHFLNATCYLEGDKP